MQAQRRPADRSIGLLNRLKRNRAITGIFLVSIVAGALLGYFELPADMSVVRRILGGAVGGGGVALLMTATRMF
jgi:hypothetical protein